MKFLNASSIRTRLLAGIVLTVLVFGFALWSLLIAMQSVAAQFEGFVDRDLARTNGLQQIQADGSQVVIAAAKKLMVPSLQPPKQVAEAAVKRFDAAFAGLKVQYRGDVAATATMAEVGRLWSQIREQALKVIDQVEQGEALAAQELFNGQVQKDWGQVRKIIQPLIAREQATVDAARAAVQSDTERAIWQGLWFGLAALVSGLLVSLFFSAQVSRLVSDAAQRLAAIAEGDGDLNQRLDESGAEDFRRLAHGFNTFTAKIQSLVRDVAGSTAEMNGIAGRLTEIASATHGNATRQNDVSTQVATAISEMSASVRDVAENAQQAADAAMAAERQVVDGNQIVADTREAIRGLNQQVGHAADTMNSLEKETEKVGSVLTVIREIAEQTNLLALNAAIEAARAGEQGRGFAVVADEVRTLAARTQQSTQEIESMIDSLQTGARSMAGVMEAGREEATRTADEADRAHGVLAAINEAVGQIHEMNAGIAAAAEEQGTAAVEIERSAHELSALADQSLQTASSADETATQLAAVGAQAVEVVARFKH